MNIKKLRVQLACHYNLEAIGGIYDSATAVKAKLEGELTQQAEEIEADPSLSEDEKGYMLSSLGDDFYIAEMTTDLAAEMMIVSLYKTLEIAIKQMAIASELFTQKQSASFYMVSALKRLLKSKVCDIETINDFKAFDELRCISNSIKHSGSVNSQLASYPGWTEGEKLTGLDRHFYRLKRDADNFVRDLQREIIKKIP